MWRWEQGRLPYFQFDALRRIAEFSLSHDWKSATFEEAEANVGLPFDPHKPGYENPWRNYQRVFRDMLICSEIEGIARPTAVAKNLAEPGLVTSDEYFHFLAESHTEPSLAGKEWPPKAEIRYPLLFSLKYLLAKAATGAGGSASYNEIIGAYVASCYSGSESQDAFCSLLDREGEFETKAMALSSERRRPARESLLVLAQISYLNADRRKISVVLHDDDALEAFKELAPKGGPFQTDRNLEVQRRAALFSDGSTLDFFEYPKTVISEIVEAGFVEGSRVKKTHLVIERNSQLRRDFIKKFNPIICDLCGLHTVCSYPWTGGVIDVHHKLPLASGTRTDKNGTVLDDLVAVCPSCHRAVHRFYDRWLKDHSQKDFQSIDEANAVYGAVKAKFPGAVHV